MKATVTIPPAISRFFTSSTSFEGLLGLLVLLLLLLLLHWREPDTIQRLLDPSPNSSRAPDLRTLAPFHPCRCCWCCAAVSNTEFPSAAIHGTSDKTHHARKGTDHRFPRARSTCEATAASRRNKAPTLGR